MSNEKKRHIANICQKKHNPITTFIKGNVIIFLLGSVLWLYFSHQNSYEPEMGEYVGSPVDNRTYVEAIKDAYIPFYKGKFDPHIAWLVNVCFQIILALVCVGIAVRQKSKRKEQEHDIELSERQLIILEMIRADVRIGIKEMSVKMSVNEMTVRRDINVLKQYGLLTRIGGRKNGYWQLLNQQETEN